MQTLSNWYKKSKVGTLAGTQQYSPDLIALLEENKKFKQQLKTSEMEKEFLKKRQRTLPKKVSEVSLNERFKAISRQYGSQSPIKRPMKVMVIFG